MFDIGKHVGGSILTMQIGDVGYGILMLQSLSPLDQGFDCIKKICKNLIKG